MKKINFIATIIAVSFLYSCSDAYEVLPEDSIVSETAFTTVPDLVIGMNAVYANYYPEANIDFSSTLSDDTKVGEDNAGQKINTHNFQITASSGIANDIWTGGYATINSANRLLKAAESITPGDASELATYNSIKGDCYALRAIIHLDMMLFYSQNYNPTTESIVYVDQVIVLEQLARNSVGEVIAGIKNDLALAESLIDPAATDITKITPDFIKAVRTRIALYEGDYPTAMTLSAQLAADYPLANQTQYVNMFNDTDNTEVIFKADRVVNDGLAGGLWMFSNSGGSFLEVSNELVSIIPAGDVRNTVIWSNLDANFVADTQEHVNKYPGSGGNRYLNDIKVFRSSEMVLINAEARAHTTDLIGAALMVQSIRDARTGAVGTAPVYADLSAAIDDILLERRLELCFEGHRFIDIKRTRSITNLGVVRSSALNDCGGTSGTLECSLDVNDYRFTLPIPAQEMDGNSNMTQTAGYN